ncbi:MAG TPA: VOC family protein [Dehalococcoidia bacterium]|jgi:catechol 2,3-dioxygenase-like lactoylglutathione lyase family enzyme|nr:VOC family protein [Dehalococcoidia bacterium]
MSVVGLQHVQVNIPLIAEDEARRFYHSLLGMEEMDRPKSLADAGRHGAWYRCGDQELHLFFNPNATFDAAASSQHPAFLVDDLDGLRRRLTDAGYELEEAIPIEGRARFFTRDPGGNRVEFLSFARS